MHGRLFVRASCPTSHLAIAGYVSYCERNPQEKQFPKQHTKLRGNTLYSPRFTNTIPVLPLCSSREYPSHKYSCYAMMSMSSARLSISWSFSRVVSSPTCRCPECHPRSGASGVWFFSGYLGLSSFQLSSHSPVCLGDLPYLSTTQLALGGAHAGRALLARPEGRRPGEFWLAQAVLPASDQVPFQGHTRASRGQGRRFWKAGG